MKTFTLKAADIDRKWFVVDAEGQILGRFASQIANRLRGKYKPEFSPHMDNGDYIIVVNCEKIKVTGKKLDEKEYYRHTGWVGHLKTATLEQVLTKHPTRVITHAVKGMLPRNKLGRAMLKKLKVYVGPNHPHMAQKPEPLTLPYGGGAKK